MYANFLVLNIQKDPYELILFLFFKCLHFHVFSPGSFLARLGLMFSETLIADMMCYQPQNIIQLGSQHVDII